MAPSTDHEKEIASKVDAKAKAIQEGTGRWDNNIIQEMRIAVGFEMSDAEFSFFERYVTWRRQKPISN
jgi:hypothetical protein